MKTESFENKVFQTQNKIIFGSRDYIRKQKLNVIHVKTDLF
jgi:hypothetical protein